MIYLIIAIKKLAIYVAIPLLMIIVSCTVHSATPNSTESIKTDLETPHALITNFISQTSTRIPSGVIALKTAIPPKIATVVPSSAAQTEKSGNTTIPISTENLITNLANIPGRIYAFDGVAYGYIDPNGGLQSSVFPMGPKLDHIIGPTGNAISLALSDYSEQVAYITHDSKQVALWISDLNLSKVENRWIDSLGWIKYDPYDEIEIQWKMIDQFLILKNRSSIVLLDVKGNLSARLSNKCDIVAISPISNHISVWCPLLDEIQRYIVLERDGSYWYSTSIPNKYFVSLDWTFSPNGDRLLYASEQGNLAILNENFIKFDMPITYVPPTQDLTEHVLQWSQDGSLILVYGINQNNSICINLEGVKFACWLIINSTSGDVIWPNTTDQIFWDYGAALSPDDKWIVGFVLDAPRRYGYIVSIESGYKVQIFDWVLANISWAR